MILFALGLLYGLILGMTWCLCVATARGDRLMVRHMAKIMAKDSKHGSGT